MQRSFTYILLSSMGFACFLALNSFSLWGFSLLPETALGEDAQQLWSTPLSLANALSFIVFLIGAQCAPRTFNRNPLGMAVALIGAAVALVACYTIGQAAGLLIVAGTCMGIGTTCCFFCWARTFFVDGVDAAKAEIVLGSTLSAVPYLAFLTLEASAITVTLGVLALLNFAALFAHGRLTRGDATRAHAAPAARAIPTAAVPFGKLLARFWKPLLCVAMIGFAAPIIATLSQASTAGLSFVQQSLMVHSENLIAAVVLGVCWLGLRRSIDFVKAFTVLFPIITTALLLYFVLDPSLRIVVPYISGIAFVVFSMVVMIESINVSESQGIGLTQVYALFAGLLYCMNLLGNLAVDGIDQNMLMHETSIMIAMFALLYGCSIVMYFITRQGRGAGGASAAGSAESESRAGAAAAANDAVAPAEANPVLTIDLIDNNCRRLAEERQLSERQAEVLLLLAHGYDIPTIAKKLFVSENTVRTHTKKIYAALDVHSKQEIIELANKATPKEGEPELAR